MDFFTMSFEMQSEASCCIDAAAEVPSFQDLVIF